MDNVKFGAQDGHCCFNKMIDCTTTGCLYCGWNPEVTQKRVKIWQKERRLAGRK